MRSLRHSAAAWSSLARLFALFVFLALVAPFSAAQQALPAPNLDLWRAGLVEYMVLQDDGKLVVAGRFRRINGDYSRRYLARLNADGGLDPSFSADTDGVIVALQRNGGYIYVLGTFTTLGGVPRSGLGRIVEATGSVDLAWNPNPNPNGLISGLDFDAGGNSYVIGGPVAIGGLTNVSIAKLDPTGAGVAGWAPALPSNFSSSAITVSGSDVFVFGTLGPLAATQNNRIYKIATSSGILDNAWSADLAAIDMQPFGMRADGAGGLYVFGAVAGFLQTFLAPQTGWSAPSSLVKLNTSDGQVAAGWTATNVGFDLALSVGPAGVFALRGIAGSRSDGLTGQLTRISPTTGTALGSFPPASWSGANIYPQAVAQSATHVFWGGDFGYVNGQRKGSPVKLDATSGAIDSGFNATIQAPGYVTDLQPSVSGKVYAAGAFTEVNGQPIDNVLRLNADGSLDTSWTRGVPGLVTRMLEMGSYLYVAGPFENIDATNQRFVARFSTATQLFDAAWNPAPSGSVRALASDGTSIFMSGGFDQVGGQARTCLAKVDAVTGALDTGWTPPVSLTASSIGPGITGASLCAPGLVVAGGSLYVGLSTGRITVNSAQRVFARVNLSTGATDPSLDPAPTLTGIQRFAFDGQFVYVPNVTANPFGGVTTRVAKLDPVTGVVDPGFVVPVLTGLNAGGAVMAASPAGFFMAATVGGTPAIPTGFPSAWTSLDVIRHDISTGARDAAWNAQSSPYPFSFGAAILPLSGNRILVGSGFEQLGGARRMGIAAFSGSGATAPTSIASAKTHTLALDTTGKVFAWGSDSHGQLGQGRAVIRPTPAQVASVPSMAHISLSQHALAVDIYGQVWAWGENSCGQLGPRSDNEATKPSRVLGATGMTQVAAGGCFSIARKSDGTVWGWGLVPGYGTDTSVRQLSGLTGITAIVAGSSHALALRNDGRVLAFGDNAQGQLGLGTTGGAQAAALLASPTSVSAIAAGDVSSMALSAGQPYFWGRHSDATLVTSPLALAGFGGTAVSISVAGNRPYAARADGAVLGYSATGSTWAADFAGFAGIAKVAAGNKGFALGIDGAGQLFAGGTNTSGQLGQGNTTAAGSVVAVTGMSGTAMVSAGMLYPSVLALKNDGTMWFWGADTVGESGDGGEVASSVPLQAAIPATVKAIAAADGLAAALDTAGNVWGWGDNSLGALDATLVGRSTPALVAGVSSVRDIAAGNGFLLFLNLNGSVQKLGTLAPLVGSGLASIAGMNGSTLIAAGDGAAYALRADGLLYAIGSNSQGELGNGSTTPSSSPVQVLGIGGSITRISAAPSRAGAVTSDGRVWTWGAAPLGNGSGASSSVAVQVPGITDAVDISVGAYGTIVRRANGSLVAWGDIGLADAAAQNVLLPYAVAFYQAAQSAWASRGGRLGFIVGSTGLTWGFGRYGTISTLDAAIGDGTYVPRDRPVVLMASGGTGNIDTNDWYFDLDPTTGETVPAASTPKMLGVAGISGSDAGLALSATVKYNSADFGKSVSNYVFALVPPTFFDEVKSAQVSATSRLAAKAAKAGGYVLAQLTPAGWTDVKGQLIAYSQGTANAAGGSANILNGVNTAHYPGARFCIGYGESSGSMLSFNALREVLLLPGASQNTSGVPCILTGVYVDGPPGSRVGTSVAFKASVVGLSPTGQVQFRDGAQALSLPLTVSASNDAVATAQTTTSALAIGDHSIGATYLGDSQNAAASTEIPLPHLVVTAASQANLVGPISSDQYSEATFQATVIGASATGTVQFMDGVTSVGAPVPLGSGQATLRISTLALGSHSITAVYSGDGSNAGATSNSIAHTVVPVFNTHVTLTSSTINSVQGTSITLTATVTGITPTGSVTFRDGANVLGTVTLANGVASLTITSLSAGGHNITASYSGDIDDQSVTSTAIVQQVAVPAIFSMSPISPLAFGPLLKGTTSAARTITITNTGGSPLTVSSVAASGPFTQTNNCAALPASASCTIQVRFAPATEGALNGSVSIQSSLGPNVMALTGTGSPSLATHYYSAILRRAPDAPGLAFWESEALRMASIGANVNETWFAMAQFFYFSDEYKSFNRDDAGFVTDLYNTFFNRAPDGGGLAYWAGLLAQGMPREVVLTSFMFSAEFATFTQGLYGNTAARAEVDVVMDFYRGTLARLPDGAGFTAWDNNFRGAQCDPVYPPGAVYTMVEAISSAFTGSGEYVGKNRTDAQYVGDLYNAFLRRGGDLGGVQFWIGYVANPPALGPNETPGTGRERARRQFIASTEFNGRVGNIIAQGCLP